MFNRCYLAKISLIGLVLVMALSLANFLYVEKSSAGTSDNVSGYAWSSNIGFISFNSANRGDSAQGNYGVNIDPTTGELSGYAWSSNIGFISFNENHLTGCPSGECVAKLDLTNNKLTGWAKTASSVLAGSDSGWIRLSGSSYGINYDTSSGEFSGLAWGGNLIGWISFKSPTGLYGVTTDTFGEDTYPQLKIVPLSTINLTSGKTTEAQVYYYTSNTSSENVTNQAQWSSGNTSLVTVPSTTSGSSITVTAERGITSSQSTTISASYNGKTASRTVSVEPPVIVPTLIVSEEKISDSEIASKDIFAISKAETINMILNDGRDVYAYVDEDGDGSEYSPQNVSGSAVWTITNDTSLISIYPQSSGKQITSGVDLGVAYISVAYETADYGTLYYQFEVNVDTFCIASIVDNIPVYCENQLPQISFNADPTTVNQDQSTTLNWTVTNADSCEASNSVDSASWNGSITNFSDSKSVSLNTATTYTLTCKNSTYGTEDSKSVDISVSGDGGTLPSAPTITATAGNAQNVINWSDVIGVTSYNIYWSTVSGVTKSNGTKITNITSPYTHSSLTNNTTYYYIATAVNSYGESNDSTEKSAMPTSGGTLPSAPTITATAGNAQNVINWSDVIGVTSYNIYWSTVSGVTKSNGTKITNITSPYTHSSLTNNTNYYYIATAVNSYGESNDSTEKSATPTSGGTLLSISFSSNYTSVSSGETVKLQWSVSNADSCSASGGWSGDKDISGEANVTVNSSTNYYLSCVNSSGGSDTANVYVQVGGGGGWPPGDDPTGDIKDETEDWLKKNITDEETTNDDYEANYQASTETISAGTTVLGRKVSEYGKACSDLGYPNFWWNAAITLYRSVAFQSTNPNSSVSSWSWNFGEQALPKTAITSPPENSTSTKFLSATTKTIVLKAYDSDGDYCKRTKTILIGGRGEE